MAKWMLTSDPAQPVPEYFEYFLAETNEEARNALIVSSEATGKELFLWKIFKHTTVNINATAHDD